MKMDFSEPIRENWAALEEVVRQVRERTGDPEANFNAGSFYLGGSCRPLDIPVKYRKAKRNGQFTDKYYDLFIRATYCPLTGKPLYKEAQE